MLPTHSLSTHTLQSDRLLKWVDKLYIVDERVVELEEEVARLKGIIKNKNTVSVDVTAYTASVDECDSTPNETAFLTKPFIGSIAISRDLLDMGWSPGMKVYIYGRGIFVINDLMNKRFKKRIDIFVGTKKQAIKIGKTQTKATLVKFQ